MAAKLMQAEATNNATIDLHNLMIFLGRFYQIRDDYQDVISVATNPEKHSDLDQVAFTLPVIHAINKQKEQGSTELLSMLQSCHATGHMGIETKKQFLGRLKELGSLEHTKEVIDGLYNEILNTLCELEGRIGVKNWILRLLLFRLKL